MQLRSIITSLLVIALAAPAALAADCSALFANGQELWMTDAGGNAQRLIRDERGIAYARWSPSRQLIAYVSDFDLRGPTWSHIVVIDARGEKRAEIPISAERGVNDFIAFGWIGEKRLWTEGHVTPSSSIYHQWDIESGRAVEERLGAWFAPSPDGSSIAYREHVPHGAPPDLGDRVFVDDRLVFPAENDRQPHRVSEITWAGARQLVFVDEVEGRRSVVALDPRGGGMRSVQLDETVDRIVPDRRGGRVFLMTRDGNVIEAEPATGRLKKLSERPSLLNEPFVDLTTNRLTETRSKSSVIPLDVICE